MSGRRKTWFGIAKTFVKAVEKANASSKARSKQRVGRTTVATTYEAPSITVTVTDDDGKRYVNGMRRIAHSDKYDSSIKSHLKKLATFYREHAVEYEVAENENPAPKFIHDLFPIADAHTCPHCGVIHEFTATRARKCPDCGNQMIVRQGVFLKQEQVDKFEKVITNFYDKIGSVRQLKNCVERIQSYLSDDNYGQAFLSIAEGYQSCAVIFNQRYEGGYSAWDFAWGALGEASEAAAIGARSQVDLISNGYTDVAFARGMHCLRELKNSETSSTMNKYAKIAIGMFYSYLIALKSIGLTDWHQENAIKNIHIAEILGNVSKDDIKDLQTRSYEQASLKPSKEIFESTVTEVEDYIFLETDNERLRQYIY